MPRGVNMPRRPAPPLPPIMPQAANNGSGEEVFELHMEETDPTNSPPLYQAICGKDPNLALHVLQHSTPEEIGAYHGHTCYSYLHLLVMVVTRGEQEKCLPMVYQLSNAGADMNAADATNVTPLQMAIDKGLTLFMVALIRCGVDLCDRDYKGMVRESTSPYKAEMQDVLDKYTPGLWAAVGSGSTGIVNLLVNSWCRINIYKRLPTGAMSLLMYAQRGRQPPELIALLDDYEVTIEFVHATLAGDEIRMQDFLMDSKPCDPYIMDIAHQDSSDGPLLPRSLRDAAIAMGHTHVLHLLPEGDYESGQKSTIIKETSVASCLDYSSGSNPDSVVQTSVPKPPDSKLPIDPITQIQTDTQFMTIGRAPRLSTFNPKPITAEQDRHYVQGFYFHEPEPPVEHVFQGEASLFPNASSPMGSVRSHQTYGNYHDYSKNWNIPSEAKDRKGKEKGKGSKDKDKTKSKLCVVM